MSPFLEAALHSRHVCFPGVHMASACLLGHKHCVVWSAAPPNPPPFPPPNDPRITDHPPHNPPPPPPSPLPCKMIRNFPALQFGHADSANGMAPTLRKLGQY